MWTQKTPGAITITTFFVDKRRSRGPGLARGRRLRAEEKARDLRPIDRETLSPGAGLATAEEQADAAFKDLLNTSALYGPQTAATKEDFVTVRDRAAGDAEGMDGWKQVKSKGPFGDAIALFNALSKGAHIVRRDDGTI